MTVAYISDIINEKKRTGEYLFVRFSEKKEALAVTTEQVSELLAQFPKVELALNPTPLHPMQRLQQDLGCGPLFIKRDDLNGLGVGGNKIRNLEYLLGDALAQGKKTILASGQTQSNLCSLCAAACCRLGLRCVLVHNSPPPKQLEGNALLNHLLGAKEYYMGEASEQERADFVEQLRVQLEQQGEEPYVIENGASSARGALGYVEAAVEIARQIQQDSSLSSIQSVCIPAGNGGLAAGMIYGTALLGNPFHIELISVEHPLEQLRAILLGFLQDLEELCGVKMPCALEETVTLHGGYRFGGWGKVELELEHFTLRFAQLEGIFVEKVYTGKTLYGVCDLAKQGYFPAGACYLHSGGLGALFSQYPEEG